MSLEKLTDSLNGTTYRSSYTGSTTTFYISVFMIWGPGTLSNLFAVGFIVRDMQKAIFPAIFLLFVLCCCDLCAVISSWTYHIIIRYVKVSFPICASTAFTFTFFNISASVTNAVMAVDRVLAICYPFFYKKTIEVKTWLYVCLVGGILVAFYSVFPFIGLGEVMSQRGQSYYCDSFTYQTEPVKRVFGVVFGLIGVACVLTISVGNSILIKTLLTLTRRVTCVEAASSSITENTSVSSSSVRATPFEIAFAKLMISLAAVYLLCGAPMQVTQWLNNSKTT